jgi:hypothetical protein
MSAIAAVRTAEGYKFFAAKTHAATAAVAGLDPDSRLIDEFHWLLLGERLMGEC